MKPLLTITLLLFSVATCFGFQTEADHCQRLAPKYHSKLEAGDTPAVRAYMIQNNNGRWLRREASGEWVGVGNRRDQVRKGSKGEALRCPTK